MEGGRERGREGGREGGRERGKERRKVGEGRRGRRPKGYIHIVVARQNTKLMTCLLTCCLQGDRESSTKHLNGSPRRVSPRNSLQPTSDWDYMSSIATVVITTMFCL